MSLEIIVVGAGIAGLCAAVALRQQGHSVTILEKSSFATETGAALTIQPNGTRVLNSLSFSFQKSRARKLVVWETVTGDKLAKLASLDFGGDVEGHFGAAAYAIHRVDLHTELLRLATTETIATSVQAAPVRILLGMKVVNADAVTGTVQLDNGELMCADLIVGADGLKSVLRNGITDPNEKTIETGLSAFRFLIDTSVMEGDDVMKKLLEWKTKGSSTVLADVAAVDTERHMVWYDCRDGEVQNFVGVHPTRPEDLTMDESSRDFKSSMLEEFSHFHPSIVRTISAAENVKNWPLGIHNPMRTWHTGKLVLIGDAAHPMLPFSGQGANQALEDGAALAFLLGNLSSASLSKTNSEFIEERLKLFEQIRVKRASRVQIMSKVRVGREREIFEELKVFSEGKGVPTNFQERTIHDFGFDVLAQCAKVLKS